MKTKLKPWQITLLAIFSIMFAALASIFSLKADTVDEEETPEELVDNWELGIVFYDSFVDNGMIDSEGNYVQTQCKTPLTSINWDASNNGYGIGDTRVITVQINYKNTNVITGYNVGDLKITIPNLIRSSTAQWSSSVLVGANDTTHTGYDWNFKGIRTDNYGNKYTYSTPDAQSSHFTFTNAINIDEKTNFEGSIQIVYTITPLAETSSDSPAIERYENECIHNHSLNFQAVLEYNKILEDSTNQNIQINSNKLDFNYTRTYKHPWRKVGYTLTKSASALSSLDGLTLSADDYYFVKYSFYFCENPFNASGYPYIFASNRILKDTFSNECILFDENLQLMTGTSLSTTEISYEMAAKLSYGGTTQYTIFYVAYPKATFNEENNNLILTNTGYVYGIYATESEESLLCEDDITINLQDFDFAYPDQLYSIYKGMSTLYRGIMYSSYLLKPDFYHSCYYCNRGSGHITTGIRCNISTTAYYTGSPMTVRFGDDLLYITANDGSYRKLEENEYVFDYLYLPNLINKNNIKINYNKYTTSLYVKYANTDEFVFYMDLSSKSAGNLIDFEIDEKIVAFYIQIEDMTESLSTSSYSSDTINRCGSIGIHIKPTENILEVGKIYNFAFLEVFFKDNEGNLILQNETELSNYATLTTQDNIAESDLNTYGHYMQRDEDYWEYKNGTPNNSFSYMESMKLNGTLKQDAENEVFSLKNNEIGFRIDNDEAYMGINIDYINQIYWQDNNHNNFITSINLYDLLPKGMILLSTKEEMLESFTYHYYYSHQEKFTYFYNIDGNQAFSSFDNYIQFFKDHSEINVIENWNNTGRTKIEWNINFPEYPLFFTGPYSPTLVIKYNAEIPYDSYMEYGQVWTNYVYSEGYFKNNSRMSNNASIKDNGYYDTEAYDINSNNNIDEKISYAKATTTINSVISTHQDVTTFVKTDHNYFTTSIADSSINTEYQYKLRVRTGNNKITNLILYCNLEEAQQGKSRWKGDFLGFDTFYAQSKGYNIKTYYSENPAAGNIRNEEGTLNPDWKEYTFSSPAIYKQGLEVKFNSQFETEKVNYDYVEIYYILNGVTYKLGKWGGKDLAGKTLQIPSNDFYLYWHTDNSNSSYYGFSIDSITYTNITNTNTTTGKIPSYTIEEISGNTYPDSAFGSYTHGNYGNSVNKLWHYTYTGEKELIQEATQQTDNSKVKSLAFEYLDSDGNAAILPANSLTYILINMKSPADESITTLARNNCRTQWNALDEFDQAVDFITGINSNVAKVALPNSVKTDDMPSISLRFTKEINGTASQFENMKLDKAAAQTFIIKLTSLTANDDETYNQVTGLLNSNTGLIISQIPIGTYLLEELGDNYFDFVEFTDNNDPEIIIEGVTFERTDQGYIITVSEDLTENIEFNIKVTNEIEDERFFEDKNNKENLFLINKAGIDHNTPED